MLLFWLLIWQCREQIAYLWAFGSLITITEFEQPHDDHRLIGKAHFNSTKVGVNQKCNLLMKFAICFIRLYNTHKSARFYMLKKNFSTENRIRRSIFCKKLHALINYMKLVKEYKTRSRSTQPRRFFFPFIFI